MTDEMQEPIGRQRALPGPVPSHGLATRGVLFRAADDTIATLAKHLSDRGRTVGVLTGDHDLHQIVTARVHVLDPNPDRYELDGGAWKRRDVRRRWGVEPSKIPSVKALMGDKSDDVPGVTGIGEKWGKAIVAQTKDDGLAMSRDGEIFVTIDGSGRASKKKATTLNEERDRFELFRRICTVYDDVEVVFAPREYDANEVESNFRRLRFTSLLAPSTLRTVARVAGR